AALPSIKSTKAILIHAREMIKDNLNRHLLSLGKSDVEEWISFVEGNSHDILLRHIKRKELSEAKLIWIRHLAEFTLMFDAESITEILEEFRSYDEESILDWVRCFHSRLSQARAYSIVLSMESRRGWPLSGLTFAEKDECTAEAQLVLFQQRSTASSSLNHFIKLIYLLKDLLVLHNNYRLKIKLENFMEAQNGYLNEYLRRDSGLNSSDIYGDYLLDLIENTSATWHWNAGEAHGKRKAVVILKSLKAAPVPWSKVMTDLCTLGSVLPNASFSVAIKEQELWCL
ncbi:Kinetochoreassociated protein 1like, partial [Caligus rogercresseyi]